MRNSLKKIPLITEILLVSVSAMLVLLIYLGGNVQTMNNSAGETMDVPVFTDALLYWSYFLLVLAIVVTLFFAIRKYTKFPKQNSSFAFRSLVSVLIFLLIFFVSWMLGSDKELPIIGYQGTDNIGFWSRFSDMMIYASYFLLGGIILTIAGTALYSNFRKNR
jgi:Na+/alanine symporter